MINGTATDVSICEGISDTMVQNIIDNNIGGAVNWKRIKRIGLLGIDEIAIKKGHKDYLTIITSRIGNKNRIIAVLKGKEKATIVEFFRSIPKKKHKTIDAICCDMYEGYVNAAKDVFCKDAPIIIDRFHVAKLYRESLIAVRKIELRKLRRDLSSAQYSELKHAISILVNKNELYSKKDKEHLELLFKHSPTLKLAYKLARKLTGIYNKKHRKKTANKKIHNWVAKVKKSNLTCFNKFIKTLTKHQEYITNYFIDRNTSGFVEGINNKIKVIKRRCYGLTNVKNFFQRIFLDLEGYGIYLKNQTVTA